MISDSSRRPPAPNFDQIARDAAGKPAATPTELGGEPPAGGHGRTRRPELVPIGGQHQRPRRRVAWPTRRWLGAVEYTLLALIGLGVAITIVMAIVNP